MMMEERKFCPCCGRNCDLEEPHCERGREYRRTGGIAEGHSGRGNEREEHKGYDQAADIQDKIIFNLLDVNHIMRILYEGKGSQKRILMLLNKTGNITQRELTERIGIQPGSASEVIAKLEEAGFIIRTPDETDRRTMNIALTENGKEAALEAAKEREQRHKEMFSCLSANERNTLLSLLEKVNADWKIRYHEVEKKHRHFGHRHGEHKHHGRERH